MEASRSGYPLLARGADRAVVARQKGRPIESARFRADVAALAARLPDKKYLLNLCTDRYRFMVGFAAALCRQQISLLPPNDTPGAIAALVRDFPETYALADTTRPSLPTVIYPDALDRAVGTIDVPIIPAEQPAVILFTSGSTGDPKPVTKSWGVLVRSARAAGERLDLSRLPSATVIGTVPHQHSYGLESIILLALQHGLSVDAERPFFPADIRAAIAAAPRPVILVTTPVHIRALVTEAEAMPPLDLILSATAPLTADLAGEAEARFAAPLIEIYGCTEAGQIATRRTAEETEWRCLDGVSLRQGDGGVSVAGPAVPAATPLQDVIACTGADTFLLQGRSAELVDVAGKHTSLAYLNRQLLSIEGIKDGAFVVPESEEGRVGRLMALVVAPELRAEAIMGALRQRIDAAFLPRPLIVVDALPRNSLGKLPREAVVQLVQQSRC